MVKNQITRAGRIRQTHRETHTFWQPRAAIELHNNNLGNSQVMAEGGGGGTRVLNDGGRQRFQVELRPGETTIVSWKKLVKDANRASASVSAAAKPKEQPPVPKPPVLNPRVDPVNHSRLFHFISHTCFSDYVFFYCSLIRLKLPLMSCFDLCCEFRA